MVFNLSDHDSIASEFLFELRDKSIQTDRMRFRKNLERLGEILAYEISKQLTYENVTTITPLAKANVRRLTELPVLLTILRAGLPFTQGFLNFFDRCDTGFIGAFREESGDAIEIKMNYVSTPTLSDRDIIVIDPMLATGGSIIKVIENVLNAAAPRSIQLASVIASPEGLANVRRYFDKNNFRYKIWVGAIDRELNSNFYIVPGLGDAGDLSYGTK